MLIISILKKIIPIWLIAVIFLTACAVIQPTETQPAGPQPTPTSNHLFVDQNQAVQFDNAGTPLVFGAPTVASFFEAVPTDTPRPTSTPVIKADETPLRISVLKTEPITITLFTDTMNPNWHLATSNGVIVDDKSADFVHSGEHAIAVNFNQDFETVNFLVSPDTTETYLRDNVLAVSFWLNGGKDAIATDELGVTVFGSNDYPYWVPDDNSVTNVIDPVFSETRLYYLGINRTIPPDTWVKIDVWLADIIYDPLYNYLTGFYIKNGEGFDSTIYIDDVSLLLQDNALRMVNQVTPESLTSEVTSSNTGIPFPSATITPILGVGESTPIAEPPLSPTPKSP